MVITMADESTQPTQPQQQPPQTVVIKETQGWGLGTRLLLWLIAIVVVLAVIAFLTISVTVLNQPTGSSFPFTTSYRVSLPDGEAVTIGNSRILVLTMGNEVDTSVDGSKERLAIGQERTISARNARISALGVTFIDTDFQIVLKYIGPSGTNALFDMKIMTLPAGTGVPHPAYHPAGHGCPANLNIFLTASILRSRFHYTLHHSLKYIRTC